MTPERARRAISLVDLTNLDDHADDAAIDLLCSRALAHRTAAVCVWPDFVARAVHHVGDAVGVATVVNFPTGDERLAAVRVIAERALDDGATEIDLVLPYRPFAAGDGPHAAAMVHAIRSATADRALLKVILETGELVEPDLIRAAADLAIGEGADFVKTSTGKTPVSATPEAVTIMLDAIVASGRRVGIKPSGGIRTADDADRYLSMAESALGVDNVDASTFRYGASGVLDALVAVERGADESPSTDSSY